MSKEVFVLSAERAGNRSQAFGLSERCGFTPIFKSVTMNRLWTYVPMIGWPSPLSTIVENLKLPRNADIISVGGTGGKIGAVLHRCGHKVVQILNPRTRLDNFDLVIANCHDELKGENVLSIRLALHPFSPGKLAEAQRKWGARLSRLPKPLISVLIGGSNGRYRFDKKDADLMVTALKKILYLQNVGIAITLSRRTGIEATSYIQNQFSENDRVYVWDGKGDNPYGGLLACADGIIVTMDSVSMISEAVATRVPVLLYPLRGNSKRINRFIQDLVQSGRVRFFTGQLQDWPVLPMDDTSSVVKKVKFIFSHPSNE